MQGSSPGLATLLRAQLCWPCNSPVYATALGLQRSCVRCSYPLSQVRRFPYTRKGGGKFGPVRRLSVPISPWRATDLQVRASGTTDADMRVPDAHRPLGRLPRIPLHQHGARRRTRDGEQNVLDLNDMPTSPGGPTCTTARGICSFWKLTPRPMISDQA